MRFLVASLVLAVCVCSALSAEIPPKFLGKWVVDHSDSNFDEYLQQKGYGWITRNLIKTTSITKIFEKKDNGNYHAQVLTFTKNLDWDNFQLDVPFQAEYLDSIQHTITFVYDPATESLTEKHAFTADGEAKTDDYGYTINGDGFLVMNMVYKGVSTNRYYKKE